MAEVIQQKETQNLSFKAILKSDLFLNLFPQEEETVLNRTGEMLLRKGALLFSPGAKAEHIYLLKKGLVRVLRPGENNDEEIARFAPGDIIGDFDFARGAVYDAGVEALEDSSLIMFPGFGISLDDITLESPHIVSKMLLNAAAMVTGRIKGARKLLMESVSWVQELYRQVHEDPGTGLWKQSFLADEINRILENPMALIMLKPDRFKILVDSNGHDAGDEAMVKIAVILKDITRRLGRGWALRFRSNETGILVNKCDAGMAKSLADSLSKAIAGIPRVSLKSGEGDFLFSGSIAWGIWPADDKSWDSLFEGTYSLLLDTWKAGGNTVTRYRKEQS
jgi:diguanylate cyclase (GGDEF)-like protein